MVFVKLAVVVLVICVGAFYVSPANWTPFAPNGISGVLSGIAGVFFAYIGFDAISTTAEECNDPQKDLPRATIFTLLLCTLLYVIIAFVLTGMVSYKDLGVADPLAFVFKEHHVDWIRGIISLSAIFAMASVFLVFQLGQPRIWMSMARDGLLPERFASIHPRFKTPAFSTVVTGIVVAIPTLVLNQAVVTDLCSIGTLFAFMLVSAGVIVLQKDPERLKHAKFQVPYYNGKFAIPILFALYLIGLYWLPASHGLQVADFTGKDSFSWEGLSKLEEKIPYLAFIAVFAGMAFYAFRNEWSIIPVLGVLTNLYLIAGLGHNNWKRFAVWCAVGFAIYFFYGYSHSKLNRDQSNP